MSKLTIKSRFAVTPNELLKNPEISYKAKGLYAQIQSKPDGWDFSAERLALEGSEGRDSIRSGLRELEKFGFLLREKYKDSSGCFQIEYTLYETSFLTRTDLPTTDLPTTANPSSYKERDSKKEIVISNSLPLEEPPVPLVPQKKTAKDEAEEFFSTDIDSLLINLNVDPELKEKVREELIEFIDYWTEGAEEGRPLWKSRKTYFVRRRLARWFRNSRQFGKRSPFQKAPRVSESVSSFS